MKLTTVLSASLLILAPLVAAVPVKHSTGSYTVSGLGSRKKAITSAGETDLDLAIATILTTHTRCEFSPQSPYWVCTHNAYTYIFIGHFKQNWYMLRSATNRYK
jgi:hypothetical protein